MRLNLLADGFLDLIHDDGHGGAGEARVGALETANHGVDPADHLEVMHEVSHVLRQVLCHLLVHTAETDYTIGRICILHSCLFEVVQVYSVKIWICRDSAIC